MDSRVNHGPFREDGGGDECRGMVTRDGRRRGCVIGRANVIYEGRIPNSPREVSNAAGRRTSSVSPTGWWSMEA